MPIGLFGRRHMDIHGLDPDPSGPCKAVHDQVHARQEAGRQGLGARFHPHSGVLIEPSAGLDIDLLAGREDFFENIAIAVEPEDPIAVGTVELINEKSCAAEDHVGDAPDALVGIIDVARCCQELVLPHMQPFALLHMYAENMAHAIPAEGDLSGAHSLGDKDLHSGHHALHHSFHGLNTDD